MAQKTYAGVTLEVTEDGYLVDSSKWNEEIAKEIAKEEILSLPTSILQFLNLYAKTKQD
jgi:dissimilatory sulfite reductase related protein